MAGIFFYFFLGGKSSTSSDDSTHSLTRWMIFVTMSRVSEPMEESKIAVRGLLEGCARACLRRWI
jgi:hypothetical protein